MSENKLPFRPGRMLATRFTGTLTERRGDPVERLPTPERLMDFLRANDLPVSACTQEDLRRAVRLRESVHACATAVATGDEMPTEDVEQLNAASAAGRPVLLFTPDGGRQWRFSTAHGIEDALSVIAQDAITLLSGGVSGRWALCASPTCRAAYFDTSRGGSRRWCDMNTCGNREKKARFSATHRSGMQD